MRSGQIAYVKGAVEADIISVLDVKVGNKIDVIGAAYHYVAILHENQLHLRLAPRIAFCDPGDEAPWPQTPDESA